MFQVNGILLHVEEHGSGKLVLLLNRWPDSPLAEPDSIARRDGFGAIAPDLRGFGRSDRPEEVAAYSVQNPVAERSASAAYEAISALDSRHSVVQAVLDA